jgi:hypothetical protein
MEKRKKALLIALVIGDGYIRIDKRYPKAKKLALKFCHCLKQKPYLEHKLRLLQSLVGGKTPRIRQYTCKAFGKEYQQVRAEKAHKYFRVLRKWMYPNKYSPNVLKHLTAEAIAIWFMDDGSLVANNRYPDGTCSSSRTNIHTCCTEEVAQEICEYFKNTWDIQFKVFKEKANFSIRCNHKEGRKFHKLIHPYIIPSMQYKQRFYYNTSA